ncbi:MAG: beta-galactosidase [Myxacorys chilensis ATA2-1-KO14]|jgi:hypothetical protein|nr:beta-galactosidase [Myxacorys chilensis ATA2-1-KO14]
MKRIEKTNFTTELRLTRRQFTLFLGSSVSALIALSADRTKATSLAQLSPQTASRKRPVYLGTTFSQLQCRYLGLDYQKAFSHICSLGFDYIRLCSYWNEIEPLKNQFDFTILDWLLDESHRQGIDVVLTVGMKSPRWPEFHFPKWLSDRCDTSGNPEPLDRNEQIADYTLQFIQTLVKHTRHAPSLKYWQVENEPFTRLDITAGRYLSYGFVRREVELVRSLALPKQKVLMTNSLTLPTAEDAEDERAFQESLALADAVGMNVYTKVPVGNSSSYLEPEEAYRTKLKEWQKILVHMGKEDWIAEAQAEPWEPHELVATRKTDYLSSTPKRVEYIVTTLMDIGYSRVLLWGCEYWYWNKINGRNLWWWTVQKLLEA